MPLWVWVSVLGCVDVGLTWWGLAGGWVVEVNPIMAHLFNINPWCAVGYGAGLNAVAAYAFHLFESSRPWIRTLLIIVIVLRCLTLVLHAVWLVQVFVLH